jgi:hypothetical protein
MLSRRSQAKVTYLRERDNLVTVEKDLTDVEAAKVIARSAANVIQARVCGCVAGVVSRCLEAVFEEPYEFSMSFVERRGRTEVDLSFKRRGREVDPVSASGGGVVDVASFALRLAALLLSAAITRKILILDEPFKFVSHEFRHRIACLLTSLAKEMGIQIIMVTHIDELKVGLVHELTGN